MADYPSRRSSAAVPPSIPPPPPLPPTKQHPDRRSYFSRFVTQSLSAYGSRPPSAQAIQPDGGRPNPLVPRLPGISSGSSQDASHKTGLEITALDINRERTHAILAGREILKTIRINDAKCAEDINLRAAIINYAAHNTAGPGTSARHRETLEIHDVKWSHGQFDTHIATAATNGKVILYDLNRAGMELARLHEHHRQVHKVAFNPHQGYLLLSGSQDGTVRLWDLRDMRKDAMTCLSRERFSGQNEPIRDVQWSPTDGVEFAFGTDNGTIQRWDFRNSKSAKLRIQAHPSKTCTSVDWHPDGKHLLSASVDKTVRIWDFSSEAKRSSRQSPAFVLRTPYPVFRARWRPPYWSEEFHEQGSYQCTQLATSYDRDHAVVHLWDFRRPCLPFREIHRYSSAPSDMLWHSRDFLWTVGREGVFTQTDVHFSPKVVDRRNLQAFAVSPSGEVSGFAQKRPSRRRSDLEYSTDDTYITDSREKRSSPEKNSLRSSADDSVDDSFLSSSLRRHHGRTASNRSTKSFGSTPPSSDTPNKVMFLTDSMALHSDSLKPNQVAFRGVLPGSASVQIFTYLAQKYKAIPLPDPPTVESFNNLQRIFAQNAEYAQRAAFYRLAETWRVVGASISNTARRRAELHKNHRLAQQRIPSSHPKPHAVPNATPHDRQYAVPLNPAVRAIYSSNRDHQGTPESTSNLATPLARPYPNSETLPDSILPPLPNPDHEEDLSLPPAVVGPHSGGEGYLSPDIANRSSSLRRPSFNGPNWYNSSNDIEERRAMIGSWRAPPRAPLSLDPPNTQGISINIPPRLDRHDSDESFAMFSASTDSQRGISMPSSFASGKSHEHSMDSISEKWQHPLTESSFGNASNDLASNGLEDSFGKSVDLEYSPTAVPIGKGNGSRSADPQGAGRADRDPHLEHASRDKAILSIETLRKNNQLLRHDSSESEAYSRGDISEISADYMENMEASGTIVPDGPLEDLGSPHAPKPHAALAPAALDPAADEPIVLADFQAADLGIDAEDEAGFTVIDLLRQILAFHTSALSDAQTSSLLLLLLGPLLPRTDPAYDTTASDSDTLTAYADHFTSLGMSHTQTETILSTNLTPLLQTGINPYQAESILTTYHMQLHSLGLYNAAASLRRLAYPTYPAVYEQALKDTQLGLLCLSCNSPINNPRDKMRCETCKRAQAPCPICWGRYPAFEGVVAKKNAKLRSSAAASGKTEHRRKRTSLVGAPAIRALAAASSNAQGPGLSVPHSNVTEPRPTLWTWCPLCGHGGHTACLSAWFADPVMSEGACATEGCLCDCVRGRRREERLRAELGIKVEKERGKVVKGDDWKVGESRAVIGARGA
ncbi:WD40 repeat-like protein, partial [Lepidopterella palustris CBS 459.81]